MPTSKRKAQRAGLKQGRYGQSKVFKSGKENFTVYLANAALESDAEHSEEPGTSFSSLPVHGTLFEPTYLRNGPEDRADSPEAPRLRPASFRNEDDILPDLEPVSDDEEEGYAGMQADNEQENDDADWDETHSPLYSGFPAPSPNPFVNPWTEPNTTSSTTTAPADSWRFNYSADDEYYEEYKSDDFRDCDDDDTPEPEEQEPSPSTVQPEDDSADGKFVAPSTDKAKAALKAINNLLRPPRNKGAGYKKCDLHLYTRTRLEWMASFLHLYTSDRAPIPGQPSIGSKWISSSLAAAHAAQKGSWTARKLREWTRAFLKDPEDIPMSPYGSWNRERCILEDADVANEIAMHLQSLGKYVGPIDIVHYIDRPEVKNRLKLKKGIHLSTAQRWMSTMGYRWTRNPSGQYVDGHERKDVVYYRQTEFIPAITELEHQTRKYANRSLRFLDAYRSGLDGKWAAYAAKQYRGHRTLPQNLFDKLRAEGYTSD
ncbi:hypothetical protein R3P38DRAFT_2805086 [Favolaschia claudopus]|uniref:Uncharacterized protein n=1 Tax=Favolaschia claudopus TaxID=2862362 RepID=A0AAV9ZPJ9_9AGAR